MLAPAETGIVVVCVCNSWLHSVTSRSCYSSVSAAIRNFQGFWLTIVLQVDQVKVVAKLILLFDLQRPEEQQIGPCNFNPQ